MRKIISPVHFNQLVDAGAIESNYYINSHAEIEAELSELRVRCDEYEHQRNIAIGALTQLLNEVGTSTKANKIILNTLDNIAKHKPKPDEDV